MEEISVSVFKATCLAVLDRVGKTKQPLRITKFGRPIAEVVPPSTPPLPKNWLGCMAGTGVIRGDIVSPVFDEHDWDALK